MRVLFFMVNSQLQRRLGPGEQPSAMNWREVVSFFKTLAVLIVIAILLRGSVVEAFKIPSGSMIPTLTPGDHILVSKFSYGIRLPFMSKMLYRFGQPQRGDVVVFTRPDDPLTMEDESTINIIKRVMGLPGDVVEVRGAQLYIDNQIYSEPYARWADGGLEEGEFGPSRVPEGHILLLGDNRDQSKDSRFWNDPFLDLNLVKGRALIIYWSWESLLRIGTIIR